MFNFFLKYLNNYLSYYKIFINLTILNFYLKVSNSKKLLKKKSKLKEKYLKLIEDAYNLRQTDHALSDFSEYQATKILNKINKLKFVIGDTKLQTN